MPPQKPKDWTDVLNTVAYGYASLQQHGDDWRDPVSHFVMNFDTGSMSENCLNLNVWTQELGQGKRPVLVWIHGGGFQNGSSFEMLPYDGENVVRRGDIVFVSLNHRLNALGFLDLSTVGGDEFKSSANVGMLDIAAALEWVRDNIEHFGGDPNNVTICGQSGGGGKVNALMRMPAAKGLFQKAIIQSGSFRRFREPADSSRVGQALAKRLGVEGHDLTKLQDLPYDELMAAANQAVQDLRKENRDATMMGRFGWGPTADGTVITSNGAKDFSLGIPLIVGFTRNEMATSAFDRSIDNLSAEEAKSRLEKMYPGKGGALYSAFQKEYPDGTPEFLYSVGAAMMFSGEAIKQIEERAGQAGAAPVYGYRFDWRPDIYDGRLGAFHSLEIAFTFDNTERWASATGGGERAQRLATLMSQAWINFARSGNPNHRELAHWPACDNSDKPFMVFDDVCRIVNDPDAASYKLLHRSEG